MIAQTSLPRNALVKPRPRGQLTTRRALHHWRSRAWWRWAPYVVALTFLTVAIVLVARYARQISWNDVLDSVRHTPGPVLAGAAGFAAASHLLVSCFDLIGRRYTGHSLPTPTVMAVNFISYAFTLSFGAWVGSIAFRYRLYSRLGLRNGEITRIMSMSMLTNWLGYTLLAGLLFLIHPLELPPSWKVGNYGLQWIGALLILVSLGYLYACHRFGDHVWDWHGHELYLPPWRMAVLQLTVSCTNWCLMGGAIWVLLGRGIHYDYADVLTVLLVGAVAGVLARVPGGLGVLEFVFVALLSYVVSEAHLIGSLLVYRVIYYIVPLLLAGLLYLYMEVHTRNKHHEARRLSHAARGT